MDVKRVERQIGEQVLIIETGKLAKQAQGAVTVRHGDTMVLVSACAAAPTRQVDFFPLTCEYREKFHAAGRIPGGRFMKREGRPSLKETLTARMIDRPLRSLFPKGYCDEVQVHALVISADPDNNPDVLAMVGASAALALSGIPFDGPVASVRVGRVGGRFIVNPTHEQTKDGELDLVLSGTRESVVMVEAGAKEVSEATVVDALSVGHKACIELCDMIEELARMCGVTPVSFEAPSLPDGLLEKVRGAYYDEYCTRLKAKEKMERSDGVRALRDQAIEALCDANDENAPAASDVAAALDTVHDAAMRDLIASGTRCDGRGAKDVRPITCEVGILPRAHGSALFTRGETQALVATTLGTSMDEEWVETLLEDYTRKFMLHYNFPAFSVGEVRPVRGPGRREIGHGALAERSLYSVMPEAEAFPYTVRIVSDILESNGSSSMASVCGATLSLMDAGVPLRDPVAGIAMGMVKHGDEYIVLTDILGDEDHHGDMDFKVAGTQHGITALQMDNKVGGIPDTVLRAALEQARDARIHILREMLRCLDRPRDEISAYAPRLLRVQINPSKIGTIIGPGGKTIRNIEEVSGARVEINDDGSVVISSANMEKAEKARDMVQALVAEAIVGQNYDGRVVSTKDFGAFIEIMPGQEGLCHISELENKYVDRVEDVLRAGDKVRVKVISIDDQGRVKLSRKAVLREEAGGP
ncbi:polyribonucleotide nucleotidyltransferase, partial [bacterium]|nr:polyribonucleotide nucleotidyltransferase [bacterium]